MKVKKYKGGDDIELQNLNRPTTKPTANSMGTPQQEPPTVNSAVPPSTGRSQQQGKPVQDSKENSFMNLFNNITANSNNIVTFILLFLVFFSPIILCLTILLFSIFIGSVGNGLFYLFWILIITLIRKNVLEMNGIPRTKTYDGDNNICNVANYIPYDNGSYSIYILAFTTMYLVLPMILSKNINYSVLTLFLLYLVYDIIMKLRFKCLNPKGFLGDIIAGAGLGSLIGSLIYMSPIKNLLFVNNETNSNKETCSMPSKQKFKCSVYKNGELVSSHTS